MTIPATRTAAALEKSEIITVDQHHEHFWSIKLDSDTMTHTWKVEVEEEEEERDHYLHLKMVVLGEAAVKGQSNIVMLKSEGQDGKEQEGAIGHLAKGQGDLMSRCDLSINCKVGCTFTLTTGAGPVYVSGVYKQEFTGDEPLDNTQWVSDEESCDESVAEGEEESAAEEETAKGKKTAAKRKAPKDAKKKTKIDDIDEDEDEEDEEEEEMEEEADEDEEDEDSEETEKTTKKNKKAAVKDTKGAKTGKAKIPEVKKAKKATKSK